MQLIEKIKDDLGVDATNQMTEILDFLKVLLEIKKYDRDLQIVYPS